MPGLHVHLKRRIDLDCLDATLPDTDDDFAEQHYDPAQRAAKRRRIEAVATQYLRGRPPLILSASSRGPFDKGWKNPWAKTARKETDYPGRHAKSKQANRGRAASRITTKPQLDAHVAELRDRTLSPPPSPETSRAIVVPSQPEPVDSYQDQPEPSSSDSPVQHDDSGGTEFFSVDPDPPVTMDTSESNPFWLRRRTLEGGPAQPHNGDDHPSPTRGRTRSRPVSQNGQVQIALPKVSSMPAPPSPVRKDIMNPEWQSSASASMAISCPAEPVEPTNVVQKGATSSPPPTPARRSSRNEAADTSVVPQVDPTNTPAVTATDPEHVPGTTFGPVLCTQSRVPEAGTEAVDTRITPMTRSRTSHVAEHVRSFTPINRPVRMAGPGSAFVVHFQNAPSFIKEGHRAATNLALAAVEEARKTRSPGQRNQGHDYVTSQPPASSTGSKGKSKKMAKKSKPRPVTFSSSPVAAGPRPVPEAAPSKLPPVEENKTTRRDVYDIPQSPTPEEEGRVQQQSPGTTHNSGFSTQAAMMLAQMEFQEGTMRPIAAETPGPWQQTQHQHQTPEPYVEGPSLAFTPFSEFNAELEKRHPLDASQDLPISTQELLLAASPFAFSTVKKPTRSTGSGLRFTVFPGGEQSEHDEPTNGAKSPRPKSPTPKSPTPSDRVPLRARNSQVSSVGITSQEPSLFAPKPDSRADQLPRLDFHLSLDGLGANGGLDITDRFLDKLKGVT